MLKSPALAKCSNEENEKKLLIYKNEHEIARS